MKIRCIKCKKELPKIEMVPEKNWMDIDIFCPNCRKDVSLMQVSHCVNCNKPLEKLRGKYVEGPYCYRCNKEKTEEARRKDLCIMCFIKPQSKLPTVGGEPSKMCKECLIQWTKANKIHHINYEFNKNLRSNENG